MKALKSVLWFLVFFHAVQPPAFPAEKAVFATFPIPLMVIDENHGVFIALVKKIGEKSNLDIDVCLTPPKRATASFKKGKTDVLFPAIDTLLTPDHKYLRSSEIFYVRKDFAFTRKNEPLLTGCKSLEGKKVGITLGYRYSPRLLDNKKILLDLANRDDLNVRKLFANRIDAFVVEEKSGLRAFKKADKLHAVQYDPNRPVARENIFFAFHNTPKGRRLEGLVSKALREMKQDGSFSAIMEKIQ